MATAAAMPDSGQRTPAPIPAHFAVPPGAQEEDAEDDPQQDPGDEGVELRQSGREAAFAAVAAGVAPGHAEDCRQHEGVERAGDEDKRDGADRRRSRWARLVRHGADRAYSIGRPAWVLRESSGVKALASEGIATSAMSSGVQPPLWCTIRTGRIWP